MLVCAFEILHSVQDDKIKAPFHNGDRGRSDSFGAAFVVSVRSGMRKNLVLTDKTREKIWWSGSFPVYPRLKLKMMEDGMIYFKRNIYIQIMYMKMS